MHLFNIWNENQLRSLFYSYIAGSLHVSGPQAHLQESSYSCSHNHWFSFCADLFACSVCTQFSTCFGPTGPSSGEFVQLFAQPLVQYLCRSVCVLCMDNIQSTRTERHRYWTNGCVNSCTNSPEDGPVVPKHVEIHQYTNKIVTSVGFHSIYELLVRTIGVSTCGRAACPPNTNQKRCWKNHLYN